MKSVVVTGVSSGIGYGLAKELLGRGYRVFGSVRKEADAARLVAELGCRFTPLVFDVTDRGAVLRASEEVGEAVGDGGLAGLVNNAGIGLPAPLMHQPLEEVRAHFEANVIGLVSVTQAFLPLLGAATPQTRPPGRIVNVSSANGRVALPFLGAYAGSKQAVEGVSDSLRRELLPYGIDVLVIRPGAVKTEVWTKAKERGFSAYDRTDYAGPFANFVGHVLDVAEDGYSSERMAGRVADAFEAGRPRTRYAFVPKRLASWTVPTLLPDRLLDRVLGRAFGLMRRSGGSLGSRDIPLRTGGRRTERQDDTTAEKPDATPVSAEFGDEILGSLATNPRDKEDERSAMTDTTAWPKKTREMHNHSMDSTVWNDVEFRDDDTVITTYGRSGTTWVQQIVAQMLFGPDPDLVVAEISPWVDLRVPPKEVKLPVLEAQTHRRILKTHLPLDALVFSPKAKYLYIGRDGRDALWSFYNFHLKANHRLYEALNDTPGLVGPPLGPPPDNVHRYWREWLDGDGYPWWSFWDNVRSWWEVRHLPNVMFVHFADLKRDMPGQMRRIASFLGVPIDEARWEETVEYCTFGWMKRHAEKLVFMRGAAWEGGARTFINKGTNGRWSEVLTPEEVAEYEARAVRELGRECARWLTNGGEV